MPNVSQRALRRALQTALSVPAPLLRTVLGPRPKNDRGHELDPQAHAVVRVSRRLAAPWTVGVSRARLDFERHAPLADLPPRPLHRVEDRFVPGPTAPIRVRVYEAGPRGRRPRPIGLFFHGGGFVFGSLDSHDGVCRYLAQHADCIVVSVDYRRAPEHRSPAAVDDALAIFRWLVEHAGEIGGDARRIAVAGDSAGGNLAAVVAREERTRVCFQLLVYPSTDMTLAHGSHRTYATGYFLEGQLIDWFIGQYLEDRARQCRDPVCSPLHADDLGGLPPACVITAGFDPLRDEGEAYARRLREAGVAVEAWCEESLIHGFFSMGGVVDAARRAIERAAETLAVALSRDSRDRGPGAVP
jgi:acetyl esterase